MNSLVIRRIFERGNISNQLTFKVYYLLKELTVLRRLLYR